MNQSTPFPDTTIYCVFPYYFIVHFQKKKDRHGTWSKLFHWSVSVTKLTKRFVWKLDKIFQSSFHAFCSYSSTSSEPVISPATVGLDSSSMITGTSELWGPAGSGVGSTEVLIVNSDTVDSSGCSSFK